MSSREERPDRLAALRDEVVDRALAAIPGHRPTRPAAAAVLVAAAVALALGPLWIGGDGDRDLPLDRGLRQTCRMLVENTLANLGS